MRAIYWYCLDVEPNDGAFVGGALEELSMLLRRPPTSLEVKVAMLPPEFQGGVQEFLRRSDRFLDAAAAIQFHLPFEPPYLPVLFVSCRKDARLAEDARREIPMAEWGASGAQTLALLWERNNKYILWHEILHLMGAEDCYDEAGHQTCGHPGCIMQWEPTEHTVGEWPFICEANVNRLRPRSAHGA